MGCYRVIVAPYVRSVGHVFAYLYTLDDDSEGTMDYDNSLLPKVFPNKIYCIHTHHLPFPVPSLTGKNGTHPCSPV